MCLLALFFRVVEDAAVVVGANREEAYARGGEPPQILDGPISAAGGVDPAAGGTWLGVNTRGVLVAVTNRAKSAVPGQPRSRGLLARDLLGSASAREAAERAAGELGRNAYAGCNILCADDDSATVLHAGDWLRVRPLPPGIHVLTARDIDDTADPRLAHARGWLNQRSYATARQCLDALQELCAQTEDGGPAMCIRGKTGGTVSSSLLALRQPLVRSTYLHAQGPPDRTPYADYSGLFEKMISAFHTDG
jgi:uncharacterized protein with NRDE domain